LLLGRRELALYPAFTGQEPGYPAAEPLPGPLGEDAGFDVDAVDLMKVGLDQVPVVTPQG